MSDEIVVDAAQSTQIDAIVAAISAESMERTDALVSVPFEHAIKGSGLNMIAFD